MKAATLRLRSVAAFLFGKNKMTLPCNALSAGHNYNHLADIDSNDRAESTIPPNDSEHTKFQHDGIRICTPNGRILREFCQGSLVDKKHNSTPHNSLLFVAHLFSYINELQLPDEVILSIENLAVQFYLLNLPEKNG
jgi:hypothetical protein